MDCFCTFVGIEMEVIKSCSAMNGGCMHLCEEDVGVIRCSCHAGYQLEADERSCTGNISYYNVTLF